MMSSIFRVGIGVHDITPKKEWLQSGSIYLWGFASRSQSCQRVHQPLSVRVLVIQDELGNNAVLAAVDLAAIDPGLTHAVRTRINQKFHVPPDSVCINVSHTHGAPTILMAPTWQKGFDAPNPRYRQFLEDQIVDAIGTAFTDLQPAQIRFGRGKTDIGFDRHFIRQDSPDRILDVIEVTNLDGSVLSVAFFASCHPVCLGDFNEVNADFPGFARERVEAETGGVAIFFQGYAGTCNPKVLDAAITGEVLAGNILSVLEQPMSKIEGPLRAASTHLYLPFQSFPTQERVTLARSAGGMFTRWAEMMAAPDHSIKDNLPVELQGFHLGDLHSDWYLAASAHEVSTDLAEPVRNLLPYKRITIMGYSNSQYSYLPSDEVLMLPAPCNDFPFCEDNYEGGISFAWYGHHAPLTTGVDKAFTNAHDELFRQLS